MTAMKWTPPSCYKLISKSLCFHWKQAGRKDCGWAWMRKTGLYWGPFFGATPFFFFFPLFTLWFILLPPLIPLVQPELAASSDCNIYSSGRLRRQSCLCCTEEYPLRVSQLSVDLEPLPLLSPNYYYAPWFSLRPHFSLSLSPPFPLLRPLCWSLL